MKISPRYALTRPEFIRIPPRGQHCPFCGLSRTHLTELVADGAVESIHLRKRNKARGVRVIVVDSLLRYMYGQAGTGILPAPPKSPFSAASAAAQSEAGE